MGRLRRYKNRILAFLLTASLTAGAVGYLSFDDLKVDAAPSSSQLAGQIDDKVDEIQNTQNQIDAINDRIAGLEDEADIIEEQMDDLNSEIINTMTEIGLKEDEIIAKEAEITIKTTEIENTQAEYEAAVQREEQQYADMVTRIRAMYESGQSNELALLFSGKGLSEMLNEAMAIEMVYEFDRQKLNELEETRQMVRDLWTRLEEEEAVLRTEKADLDYEKELLDAQKAELDALQNQLKSKFDDYEARIRRARQEAAIAKRLLQQEQQELRNLQRQRQQALAAEAAAAAAAAAAATGGGTNPTISTTSDYGSVVDNATGSDKGKLIAKYALQFVGNPYVSGGTSLTNGADCSGFTYRVYADYGYSLPRTSYQQRSAGTGVEYGSAQPGDLICYEGHVALYIGGGLIVHASNARSGIKVSRATYRTILAVRRIL